LAIKEGRPEEMILRATPEIIERASVADKIPQNLLRANTS
jgi:hypothetical protein